ncbi:MAG: hypothetical protein GX783_10590, partial [Clostridiales bacterium]|nr:hypothetical protein [Clostridiales bacterium]
MCKYIIAIDGGATKTDIVLCTIEGRVLKRLIGGPTNPNDIGFDESTRLVKEMLAELLKDHEALNTSIYSFFAGISGVGIGENKIKYLSALKNILPNTDFINNDSDGINALTSGLGNKNGMVLIAGTGSVVFVRINDKISQIGGWGYLLDDAGSGYDLGRRGFEAVLRDFDGRGPKTLLSELYRKQLGGAVSELIPEVYRKGKQFIASFAPLIFTAEGMGDETASQILDICSRELAILADTGSKCLINQESFENPSGPPYLTVLVGGLWKGGAALFQRFKNHLSKDFVFIRPDLPPVYGAAIEAVVRADYKYY